MENNSASIEQQVLSLAPGLANVLKERPAAAELLLTFAKAKAAVDATADGYDGSGEAVLVAQLESARSALYAFLGSEWSTFSHPYGAK